MWHGFRGRGNKADMGQRGRSLDLARVQREYPGMWVAFKDGEVIEARSTPYELVGILHERNVKDTTIIRVPSLEEPELIGLG